MPGKNIREFCGKPLIAYSIDVARQITTDENICVSTDDKKIIDVVEEYGLHVPFVRPAALASDTATTNDVLLHAVEYFEKRGKQYDILLLFQPTSPLRTVAQVKEALALYRDGLDMVVSVTPSHAPAVLCKENEDGYLEDMFGMTSRRQDAPKCFEYNGAIYVISVEALKRKGLAGFTKKMKYVMPKDSSIDIDDIHDFIFAESLWNRTKHLMGGGNS